MKLSRAATVKVLEEHGLCLLDLWCDRGLKSLTLEELKEWLGY